MDSKANAVQESWARPIWLLMPHFVLCVWPLGQCERMCLCSAFDDEYRFLLWCEQMCKQECENRDERIDLDRLERIDLDRLRKGRS